MIKYHRKDKDRLRVKVEYVNGNFFLTLQEKKRWGWRRVKCVNPKKIWAWKYEVGTSPVTPLSQHINSMYYERSSAIDQAKRENEFIRSEMDKIA